MDNTESRKVRAMREAFDEIEGFAHLLELKLECQRAINPEAAPITLNNVVVLLANIGQARKKFKSAATELRHYERGEIELFRELDEEENGKPVRMYRRKAILVPPNSAHPPKGRIHTEQKICANRPEQSSGWVQKNPFNGGDGS